MDTEYFKQYERAKNLGLKLEAKLYIEKFIVTFDDFNEQINWVKEYLEGGDYGHKIRHELYDSIIFPVLLRGYDSEDAWSLYWLAQTIQNIYGVDKLHSKLAYKSDFQLLSECYSLDKRNEKVRRWLLERIAESFSYAVHEWPLGVIYASNEEADDFLTRIEYARNLDTENKYVMLFNEVELIVQEDKIRSKK